MWRVAGWSLANVVLAVGIQAAVEFVVTDVFRMRSLLQIKGSKWTLNHLPYPWTMIKHAVMGLLARNVSSPCCLLWKEVDKNRSCNTTSTHTCYIRQTEAD